MHLDNTRPLLRLLPLLLLVLLLEGTTTTTTTALALSNNPALSLSSFDSKNNPIDMMSATTDVDNDESSLSSFDVVIMGGGVVGLAIARAAVLYGTNNMTRRVAIVEAEPHVLHWASGSNSGIACTGVDAAPHSLERALIRDSMAQLRPFLNAMNIPYDPCGSLVCQWKKKKKNKEPSSNTTPTNHDDNDVDDKGDYGKHDKLQAVLQESHDAGDMDAQYLTAPQVLWRENEESSHNGGNGSVLDATKLLGAVHIPGEIVVDPWLYSIALLVQARQVEKDHGKACTVLTNTRVDPHQISYNSASGDGNHNNNGGSYWIIPTITNNNDKNQRNVTIKAKALVCATGAWAAEWEQALLQKQQEQSTANTASNTASTPLSSSSLQAAPRRGQYRIFRVKAEETNTATANNIDANDGQPLPSFSRRFLRHPIQPIPTQRTKGIFVFSTLYNHIVVGPTALDQCSLTDRSIDATVRDEELTPTLQHILSPTAFAQLEPIGEYVGIRPGTNQRDYQIRTHFGGGATSSSLPPWITVAGIRSTGLTASLGIGRHVTHLLEQVLRDDNVMGQDNNEPSSAAANVITAPTPLPPVADLIRQYQQRGDGCVEIQGHVYKVTHPLTRFGWEHTQVFLG